MKLLLDHGTERNLKDNDGYGPFEHPRPVLVRFDSLTEGPPGRVVLEPGPEGIGRAVQSAPGPAFRLIFGMSTGIPSLNGRTAAETLLAVGDETVIATLARTTGDPAPTSPPVEPASP